MFTLFFLTTGSFKPLRRLLSIFVKEKTGSSVDLNDKTILFKALQDHAQIVAQYFDLRTQSYLKNVMGPVFGVDTYWYRQESVLREIGKTSKRNKFLKKLEYKKQTLFRSFRIREEEADLQDDSMKEIETRQDPTHELTIVSEPVLSFLISLNQNVQRNITSEHFYLYIEDLHSRVRASVDFDASLIEV